METIPTKENNPKGLHRKYVIKKIKDWNVKGRDFFEELILEPILEDVNIDAEYFVLRLDGYGKDKKHINACRKAVLKYAKEIESHLPELAKDLRERYMGLLNE